MDAQIKQLTEINETYTNYPTEIQTLFRAHEKFKNLFDQNFENRVRPQDLEFSFPDIEKLESDAKDYDLRHQHNKKVLISCELSEALKSEQVQKYTEDVRAFLTAQEILREKNKIKHLAFSFLENLQMKWEDIPQEKLEFNAYEGDKQDRTT